ncbi:helix-turn-helix transcriptional regulator [Lachnospiraceae bacterium CLA-AA-H183]
MDIVERIKEKSRQKGTNIATLEKELGIGNGVIRRWNDRKPGAEQVYKIAVCLNTTVEWLLTGKESGNLTPEEQLLVDHYRQADDRGKRNIMKTAENESAELESSASKLG